MTYKILKDKRLTVSVLISWVFLSFVCIDAYAFLPVEKVESVILTDTVSKNDKPVVPADNTVLPQEPVSVSSLFKAYMPGLTVAGYYRGYFYTRSMSTPYGTAGINKQLSVGDGVYYGDPMLYLYVGGNLTPALSFATELNLVNPMNGPAYNANTFSIFNAMLMRGSYNAKKFGTYNIVVGGIEWKKLSALTFGGNVRYNRYSIFERQPWDPIGAVKTKYAAYYETGNFTQDSRFGTSAFKGIMISGFNMPFKLNGEVMYGRSGSSMGNSRFDQVRPKYELAGRLLRKFNENELSFNSFNSYVQTDSIKVESSTPATINIFTVGYLLKVRGFDISSEIGAGKYQSPTYTEKWDGAIILDVVFPKRYTFIPISMRYYRIGKGFVNQNASFSNTSIAEVNSGYNSGTLISSMPFGGGMNSVGDLANNKQAVNINGEIKVGKLKLIIGNEVSAELEALPSGTQINIGHTINGLTWSRFSSFPSPGNFGPAGRINSYYRGVYESVNITGPAFKKYYNSLEAQIKYKNKFLGRDFYISQLNTFNSVQGNLSAITLFNDAALVRSSANELDIYYHISRDLMLDFYYGYERIKSNDKTIQQRDQTGNAIGVGFDLAISQYAALYYRHRWFAFDDVKFAGEKFKGTEGTIELKIYF